MEKYKLFDLLDRINDIGEINIPISLLKRGAYEEWALRERIYKFSGVCAKIPAANFIIPLLKEFNLVIYKKYRKKQIIELTHLGEEFSKLSFREKDRLSKSQGLFLAQCLNSQDVLSKMFSTLELFSFENQEQRIHNFKDRRIGPFEEKVIYLLQQLKLAFFFEGEIRIWENDYSILMEIVSNECSVSEKEFSELLIKRREIGLIAEEYVEFSERRRLQKIGRNDLARLVKRISQEDVCAGYDIASFDNEKSGPRHDRFIEVKGNAGRNINFFITKNELKYAADMANKYWVYCVVNATSKTEKKIVKLKNPFIESSTKVRFNTEPVVWHCQLVA